MATRARTAREEESRLHTPLLLGSKRLDLAALKPEKISTGCRLLFGSLDESCRLLDLPAELFLLKAKRFGILAEFFSLLEIAED